MTLLETLTHRHTTKAYDKTRKIPADIFAQLQEALRYSPSSVNSQPWHFFVADNDEAKPALPRPPAARLRLTRPALWMHRMLLC